MRSNRDVVRGLRLINFTHAGVLVAPACPSDNISRNLIEKNVIENSPNGIVVSDQRSAPRDGFNEGNTISRNTISRAAPAADAPPSALIDLGGDGPTPNDVGDVDQGPNTLLNFPESLNVVSTAAGIVTISGQVSPSADAGSTIELFAITALHVVSGKVVIVRVAFLGRTKVPACAAPGGCSFSLAGVAASPTGNYTATVTDTLGNTSELMFRADGKPAAGPDASFTATVDFGNVTLNGTTQTRPVDIVNDGNAPLQITGCSIQRCSSNDRDDTARFSISGCPDPAKQINPGERITLTITFASTVCGPAKACLVLTSNDLLHSPIISTLNANVTSDLTPTLALEGNASSLTFGPTTAKSARRGPKKLRKLPFRTFTVDNKGCNSFTVTISSIRRITDVARCKITDANADDSLLFVVTQFKGGSETAITPGPGSTMPLGPGETLTFRVRFNPAVPAVVNKTCPDGTLRAVEVLPEDISSVINLVTLGGGVSRPLTVPLTAKVTSDLRLIAPNDPSQDPIVTLCRSGNEFVVQFSIYDSNLNVDRASFQFMDGAGRIVGRVIDVTGLDQNIAASNLATGQSFTVVQRFSGADDNRQVANVQVTVFDKGGLSAAATSGPITANCVAAQGMQLTRAAPLSSWNQYISGGNRLQSAQARRARK